MKKFLILCSVIICLFLTQEFLKSKKQTINGKVVNIIDGDSFKLLTNDSILIKVRLANIDCPEWKQPFSKQAKQFVSNAIFGKKITIQTLRKDRYRRFISEVIFNDTVKLSHELLKNGLAWHYKKFSDDEELQIIESKARAKKIGLWQDKNPIPPWEWRKNKKIKN